MPVNVLIANLVGPASEAPHIPARVDSSHNESTFGNQRYQRESFSSRGIALMSTRGRVSSNVPWTNELANHEPHNAEDMIDDEMEEPRTPRALLSLPLRFYGTRFTSFEDTPPTIMEYLFVRPPTGLRGLPYSAANAPTIAHNQIAYHAGIAKDFWHNIPFFLEADEAFVDVVHEALGQYVQVVALGFLKKGDYGEDLLTCIYTILIERKIAKSCGPYIEAKARSAMYKVAKDFGVEPLKVRCVCSDVEENSNGRR